MIKYNKGWNIVGVTRVIADIDLYFKYASIKNTLYKYNNKYQIITIMEPEYGYWIKLSKDIIINTSDEYDNLEEIIKNIKNNIAENDNKNIDIIEFEDVDWNDSSLGCPEEGIMYLPVITPGYKLVLEYQNILYEYHTDRNNNFVLCNKNSNLNTILNKNWYAIHAGDFTFNKPKNYYINIDNNLNFNGKADCNSISGNIKFLLNNKIIIGPILSTKMGCPDNSGSTFTNFLENSSKWELRDNKLIFISDINVELSFSSDYT